MKNSFHLLVNLQSISNHSRVLKYTIQFSVRKFYFEGAVWGGCGGVGVVKCLFKFEHQ